MGRDIGAWCPIVPEISVEEGFAEDPLGSLKLLRSIETNKRGSRGREDTKMENRSA